jgi:predicted DNA-binding protein (MmcQ/YjbR family)
MDLEKLREYCLKKKSVTEDFPFGETTLCFKVGGKIFAITGMGKPLEVNLKCEPELALELRERYEDVTPGYHMNKKHWNTVCFEGRIPDRELKKMLDHSYKQVVKGLKKSEREKLER